LILDCAQTAGVWPIDASTPGIGAIAFSGHKGVLGPPGVGVLWLAPGVDPEPLVFGGTGSHSESDEQPAELPQRYESGTANLVGVAGLAAGLEYVLDRGVASIQAHSRALIDLLAREGGPVDGVTLYAAGARERTGVLAFNMRGYDPEDLAAALDSSFDIAVRAGLHCAPGAHRHLGTFPKGTVRASVSALTTEGEVAYLVEALHQLSMLA
jgi:selenocysteine lyase/cysteine desulfurase